MRRASARRTLRLSRQRFFRRRATAFAFERTFGRARTFPRRFLTSAFAALRQIAPGLTFRSRFATLWRRQLHPGPPGFRQPDGDRLLRRASTMFAFPNMFHFFAHEFARLSGRGQAFPFVFARPFDWFFFWHIKIV